VLLYVLAENNGLCGNRKQGELMPKKAKKQKTTKSKALPDLYEEWLAKQPVRRVKGKSGFVSSAEATS